MEAPACCGPRIAAIIIYLYVEQFLPKKRTAQALVGLLGLLAQDGHASGPGHVWDRIGPGSAHCLGQITLDKPE